MESDETENAPTIELTRRRALAGLATIGVGSAAAGAGTFAAFSDSESTTGGFDAGTLSLSMDETSLSFSAGDIKPGDSGSSSVTLQPGGTLSGEANLTPELASVTGTAGNAGSNDKADLKDHLKFKLWLDAPNDGNETYNSGGNDVGLRPSGKGSPSLIKVKHYEGQRWQDAVKDMSNDWTFHVDWKLPDTTGNEAQGDSLDATFKFTLE